MIFITEGISEQAIGQRKQLYAAGPCGWLPGRKRRGKRDGGQPEDGPQGLPWHCRPEGLLGIGSVLMEAAIRQAGALGYEQLELGVFSDNDRARRLYHKFGFEEWGVTKRAFRLDDGTYRDEIIMGRLL